MMQYRFNSILFSALTFSATLFLFSCAKSNVENSGIDKVQRYQYTFRAVGYAPIAAQKGGSFDLQMLNAIKASKLEAYKEMAEQIYGVLLTASNDVESSRLIDDSIQSHVKGLVKGARVLKSYHEGDMYITELELDMQSLPFLSAPEFNATNGQPILVEKQVYY